MERLRGAIEPRKPTPRRKPPTKKKWEFSQIGFIALFAVGVLNLAAYWWAVFGDHEPDGAVAIAGITEILGAIAAYLIYQAKLKTSLNNNGLFIDGEGTIKAIERLEKEGENE